MSDTILTFVQTHQAWAVPLTLMLAFGESLALVSLVLPATGALVAIGGFLAAAAVPVWHAVAAAILGALLGDWVSYAIGYRCKETIARVWPLSRHPSLLPRARALFRRWGIFGVFAGRFFGPLRSVVPLAAGMTAMPILRFQAANLASAIVWGVGLFAPGLLFSHLW